MTIHCMTFRQLLMPLLATMLILGLSACGSSSSSKFSEPVTARLSEDGKSQEIDVVVNHGYKPDNIVLQSGIPATINFYRKDSGTACDKEIKIPDLEISEALPLNTMHAVHVPAQDPGTTIPFHCGMKMMHGQIMVLDNDH